MTHRCAETVCVRDTYRYTGRGKSGFEMHYIRRQCRRRAVHDGLCRQHHRIAAQCGRVLARRERP